MATRLILTGRTQEHLAPVAGTSYLLHRDVVEAFGRLKTKAFHAGFEMEVASGFRSFESQLRIWNQKALGKRPLLSRTGEALDYASLAPDQIVQAILNWSALPGASRHHWGTDVDVIDKLSIPPRYEVKLIPAEVNPGGMFASLHEWLDRHMKEEGFFRPYVKDLGGVQPERWHLSHFPTAQALYRDHSVEILKEALDEAPLELKENVLRELPAIFERFFQRISLPA